MLNLIYFIILLLLEYVSSMQIIIV